MIVSHAARFIFLHNPKSAGMSMRSVLANYHHGSRVFKGIRGTEHTPYLLDYAHLRCWELEILLPHLMAAAASYRSLLLVRNPYLRSVSAISQHFRVYNPSLPIANRERGQQSDFIEHLVKQLSDNIGLTAIDYRYVHFSPQIWFIRSEERQIPGAILAVDDKGKFCRRAFQCLGLQARPVRHRNTSRINLRHALDLPRVQSFVQAFYKADFQFFAADPALAHLAAEP